MLLTSVAPWNDSDDSFTVMPRILKGVAVGLLSQLYERFLVKFYWLTTTKETSSDLAVVENGF